MSKPVYPFSVADMLAQKAGPGAARGGVQEPKFVSLGEFVKGFVATNYLLDGILQRGRLYSLTAPTGHGKTAVAQYLSEAVARGGQFCGVETEQAAVLFLVGENPDDVKARYVAAISEGSITAEDPVHFVEGTFSIEGAIEAAHKYAGRLDGGLGLVIVDTFQAFFVGDDDNSNTQMLGAARALRKLTELPGKPTVLVPAHPVKNPRRDNLLPRGGSAFLNEVDGNVTLWTIDGLARLHWQGKFRGPDFAPLKLKLEVVTSDALRDRKGRFIPTVLARPVLGARANNLTQRSESLECAALAAIQVNGLVSERELAVLLQCASSTAHNVKKRLIDRKLIRPQGRALVLTDEGSAMLRQ